MFKEPRNWWIKQVMVVLIPLIISLVYGWVAKVDWNFLIVKWYSGWIVLIVFVVIWSALEYKRRQKDRKKQKSLKASSGGHFIPEEDYKKCEGR